MDLQKMLLIAEFLLMFVFGAISAVDVSSNSAERRISYCHMGLPLLGSVVSAVGVILFRSYITLGVITGPAMLLFGAYLLLRRIWVEKEVCETGCISFTGLPPVSAIAAFLTIASQGVPFLGPALAFTFIIGHLLAGVLGHNLLTQVKSYNLYFGGMLFLLGTLVLTVAAKATWSEG
ncbi:MAG: hypothetical protein RMM17_08430 [Acidobacteriota bacterium]|nr:hypothetical protein [Blastocatellia bacterium]MDW8412693.1 hypothetical protein [Acidobacteriota bacterium]